MKWQSVFRLTVDDHEPKHYTCLADAVGEVIATPHWRRWTISQLANKDVFVQRIKSVDPRSFFGIDVPDQAPPPAPVPQLVLSTRKEA